jgi:hypothetical protein
MLLQTVATVFIDAKLVQDDRFDDLTAVWSNGLRERVQFKHQAEPRPLTVDSFTGDSRGLLLTSLIASAIADRDGPGVGSAGALFRVVMRDQPPEDDILQLILEPAEPDPGPVLPGMSSRRFRFKPEALWPSASADGPQTTETWAFVRRSGVTREAVAWFCEHTILELGAPEASMDLALPSVGEKVVLTRAVAEVGAESYPNAHRTAVDVVAGLIGAAAAARSGEPQPTLPNLLLRTQLIHDFGAVSRAHVRDEVVEVARLDFVQTLMVEAARCAEERRPLVITGAPGQGKSWIGELLVDAMREAGWLAAEHACFVGGSDAERDARVHTEVVFASLEARLLEEDPSLLENHRPRFTSDERALAACVGRSLERAPERPIALVVDGLDHVTRVLGIVPNRQDPSSALAEALALLDLPRGAVLVTLSQPGAHLAALEHGAHVALPPWDEPEVDSLATKLGVLPARGDPSLTSPHGGGSAQEANRRRLVHALTARSGGNALYATYLCRELLRSGRVELSAAEALESFPSFDGTLEAYYAHLVAALGPESVIAEILAVLDFSVTRPELKEIYPEMSHRVDQALDAISPVVVERSGQGGVRIFHESFARFLLTSLANNPGALQARLQQVIDWLDRQQLFGDARSFRFLLPLLGRAGRDREALSRVGADFTARAVASGFGAAAIASNLAAAASSAAVLGDWAALIRCIELTRAAFTYERERLDSTVVAFLDVPLGLLGADGYAERLLFDGRTTIPARAGLLLCAAIDKAGGAAPWRIYLDAFERERMVDNTSYGEESDRSVSLAVLRGRLRLAPGGVVDPATEIDQDAQIGDEPKRFGRDSEPEPGIDLQNLAAWVGQSQLDPKAVVATVVETTGPGAIGPLVRLLPPERQGTYALAVAAFLKDQPHLEQVVGTASEWAARAIAKGAPAGGATTLLELGVRPDEIRAPDRAALLELTRELLGSTTPDSNKHLVWLDGIACLSKTDELGTDAVEALLNGQGWYRCWLRFAIELSRQESPRRQAGPASAIDALRLLTADTGPFAGTPRGCDLYNIHPLIEASLKRALTLVPDGDWAEAIEILTVVSNETGTTLMGEMGGPLPRDLLLELIQSFSNPARFDTNRGVVEALTSKEGRDRYYSDLAGFELAAARLALSADDRGAAARHWDQATRYLVAYGWRKDITIFDLLESLPSLSSLDRDSARRRLSALQPLCDRALRHTDGAETRHARIRWWELLASEDPRAASWTVFRELIRQPNLPNRLLEGVRSDLWARHGASADPLVAAALRLTIHDHNVERDVELLGRLQSNADHGDAVERRLIDWILARWDDRPPQESGTYGIERANSEEVLNAAGAAAGAHPLSALVRPGHPQPATTWTPPLGEKLADEVMIDFGRGVLDLLRAVREWARRPYGHGGPRFDVDRVVNAVGYRLVDLRSGDRPYEAEAVLIATADALRFGDPEHVLAALADGLELRGHIELAVTAHVLAFTRSRGDGGWLTFGGLERVPSLQRAWTLNGGQTARVLGEEAGRVMRGPGYGIDGMSRALIQSFAVLSDLVDPKTARGEPTAFGLWDAAFEVISLRLPAADDSDVSAIVYPPEPPAEQSEGHAAPASAFAFGPERISGEFHDSIDSSLAAAALAVLASPAREDKRRGLLATALLLRARPDCLAPTLSDLLDQLDVPTVTWVLWVLCDHLGSHPVATTAVTKAAESVLRDLAGGPHLTVRALARTLLLSSGLEAVALPTSPPLPALLVDPWPLDGDHSGPADEDPRQHARMEALSAVEHSCGDRIARATGDLPGLLGVVASLVSDRVQTEAFKERLEEQRDALIDRSRPQLPDAVIAYEESAEEALQTAAGSARPTLAMAGRMIMEPEGWEDRLALTVIDDPGLALGLEAARVPRPDAPLMSEIRDSDWTSVAATEARSWEGGQPGRLFTRTRSMSERRPVRGGPRNGWIVLGSYERHEEQRSWRGQTQVTVVRAAFEIHGIGGDPPRSAPPFGFGNADQYVAASGARNGLPLVPLTRSQPLVDEDFGPADRGVVIDSLLGHFVPTLTPSHSLVVALSLVPADDGLELALNDDSGNALVVRTWRTGYGNRDYGLPQPDVAGTDILLRPDLFERLVGLSGPLVWRELATESHRAAN